MRASALLLLLAVSFVSAAGNINFNFGGLLNGLLPNAPETEVNTKTPLRCNTVVVGGGAAGIFSAEVNHAQQVSFLKFLRAGSCTQRR